jgi:transposase-like protein
VYSYNPSEIQVKRPEDNHGVDLRKIHNDNRTLALILTSTINFGLGSRTTKELLKHLFNIDVSHQTIINYVNASAYHLYKFIDDNCPAPQDKMAADETYISVLGKWHYTWFGIDVVSRAICGFNVSDNRGTKEALAFLYDAFGKPEESKTKFTLVTDGNPSYDAAVSAYNQQTQDKLITKFKVIGLENLDAESKEYRPFKQLIERLNRTYKFHTRPRAGFKSLEGATALTVLFVGFYNFMRPHSALKNSVPVKLDILQGVEFYPDMWIKLIKAA